ncbi:hypothetical protein IFM58399_00477 [Aspergillus lentulus]|uniref:Uncharacterized protein n=2 Tax=Aspergillus lentulus TaxID=293939 RepID=A0AAN6BMP2_ASPLE|nr:uncharacterized protein IFM58399_00477 [Aspergillus lentulus]KAF4168279.1 hypothetical protein CNMCM6936_003067 [Aspergillus lentulus]KAF4177906.1 hypothetical protein CNMCM8060_005006 [Aspergillus lentulus]KAF4187343.1 hypothetical protein CNMCM7927_004287 [Aspergillus lentulus]KAF4198916.1 hypothetical protein CNMCM8694_007522 [Aspergillus lentulus]KAF4203280.1 hypothetical protein CNMCM8927_008958 [Aspergillus lentulus]
MQKAPSTEDVEILRTRRFPYDRIAHIFGLGSCTGAEADRIWHSDVTEAPDFLRNVIDALACLRWRNTPLTMAYLWTVEGPLADAKIKVLLTSVIALEAGMTVVPREEFYKKEPPIALRPKVGIVADVQYHGKLRRLKIRAPWTIWHGDEEDAGVSIVIFQTEVGRYAEELQCCLAYMGAIHRARKSIHQDACIYGIATDGQHWMFIRIDNESKYSFGFNNHALDQVYTFLRTMVRHAMHLASQRVAASTTEKLPSSIRFYDPYKKTPPESDIDTDTDTEFE